MQTSDITTLPKDSWQLEAEAADYEAWYSELIAKFRVTDRHLDLGNLPTGLDARNATLHNWYSLKEAFSPSLPSWIVEHLKQNYAFEVAKAFDPFLGSGTTGITLVQQGITVDGVEYNPFIHLVAKTKSLYPLMSRKAIELNIEQIDFDSQKQLQDIPNLSTLNNSSYFHRADVQTFVSVVSQIRAMECDSATQCFMLLGVAAAIDDVANLRKDGRALRFSNKANRPSAKSAIKQRWENMLGELGKVKFLGDFRVFAGTALESASVTSERDYDLVLFSPPYLNNFDYSEIYKLELWLLGYVKSQSEWQTLRRQSLRSHPSVRFTSTSSLLSSRATTDIGEKLVSMQNSDCLGDRRTKQSMHGVITGYFDDMHKVLTEQWQLLKRGGFLVYVVANSRHKWLPIATDVIIGEVAQRIGFTPEELIILKKRNGRTRQKAFLHESVVIMRKPN